MTSPTTRTRVSAIDPFARQRSGTNRDPGLAFEVAVVGGAVHDPAFFLVPEQLGSRFKGMVAFCKAQGFPNYEESPRGARLRQGFETAKGSDFGFELGRFCGAGSTNLGKVADHLFQGRPDIDAINRLGEPMVSGGGAPGVGEAAFNRSWAEACLVSADDNAYGAGTAFEYLAARLNRDEGHWSLSCEIALDSVSWGGTRVALYRGGRLIMLAPGSMGSAVARTGLVEAVKAPAEGPVAILSEMRIGGLGAVCERLEYLYGLQADDTDEPPILFESLKLLGRFLLANSQLATDRLGVDSTGCLTATWILRRDVDEAPVGDVGSDGSPYWGNGDGILVMVFQPTGSVRFAANSGPPIDGFERLRCSGVLPAESVLSAVSEFTRWLMLA